MKAPASRMIAILEYEIREICREASIPVSSGLDRLDADLEAHGEFALTLSAPVRDTLRELLRVRREILVRGGPDAGPAVG